VREGKRWTKMPLLWERAAGGPDTPTRWACGATVRANLYGQLTLPNLQAPGHTGEATIPSGSAPIAAGWSDRRRRSGGPATAEERARAPFGDGFDGGLLQAAPLDQQVEALGHNERITLRELHPKARAPGHQPARPAPGARSSRSPARRRASWRSPRTRCGSTRTAPSAR